MSYLTREKHFQKVAFTNRVPYQSSAPDLSDTMELAVTQDQEQHEIPISEARHQNQIVQIEPESLQRQVVELNANAAQQTELRLQRETGSLQRQLDKSNPDVARLHHQIEWVLHGARGALVVVGYDKHNITVLISKLNEENLMPFKTRDILSPIYLQHPDSNLMEPIFFEVNLARLVQSDDRATLKEVEVRVIAQ